MRRGNRCALLKYCNISRVLNVELLIKHLIFGFKHFFMGNFGYSLLKLKNLKNFDKLHTYF